jgi:hypothetical protein
MSDDTSIDYEDLTAMRLQPHEVDELTEAGGECVFSWTTTDGFPVGVVVAFVYRHGKFWTTCAERRKRVPALRRRPQSGIVINRGGKTASWKGNSTVHAPGDPGFEELKGWFFPALSRLELQPDDPYRQSFAKFLDSPHRVIIETEVQLVVGFDTARFHRFTADAIAAGQGA